MEETMQRQIMKRAILWCLAVAALCVPALAQTVTGNISGTITDPTGAVIPQAKVTATNIATNVSTSSVTNKEGVYSIRFLQVGQYRVIVEAKGFTKLETQPFALEAVQEAKVNSTLHPGSETSVVEVSATSTTLNTENGMISTTIPATAINDLPINGHNMAELMQFVPGVSIGDQNQFNGATGSPNNSGERTQSFATLPNVNGNRSSDNDYTFDGISIRDSGANLSNGFGAPAYNPNPDAIEEVTAVTTVPPAEFGNGTGAHMVVIMKNGGNVYHGSAAAYLQNYLMDANTFGNKRSTPATSRSVYTQTNFNGTFGGPVRLPWLFNGRDRLFFFADYMGYRKPSAGLGQTNVPLNAWRGNTSSSSSFDTSVSPLAGYAYFGNTAFPQMYDSQNNFEPFNQTINGVTYYNLVPIRNPVATYLFANTSLLPLANSAAATAPIQYNYRSVVKAITRNDQGDVKIDWKITSADTVSARYSDGEANDGQTIPILPIAFPSINDFPFKQLAVNYVRIISPSIVNEARGGATRIGYNTYNANPAGVFGANGDSLVGIPLASQSAQGFTQQSFTENSNSTGVSSFGTTASGNVAWDNTFEYGDNLTMQHGRHTFKAGAKLTRYQNNFYLNSAGRLGNFSYSGAFTGNPSAGTTVGYDFADFLLDYSSGLSISASTGDVGERHWRSGYFFQDDWKVTPKLNISYGLRYEYDQPLYEVNNKIANVDLANAAVILAGVNGNSRALYKPVHNDFDPRFGFAYQVDKRLVIRGGAGVTTFMDFNGLLHAGNPPFHYTITGTAATPTSSSSGSPFLVTNGFPSSGTATSTYTAWGNLKPDMVTQYSLVAEYAVSDTATLSVQYVGESGSRLLDQRNVNQYTQVGVQSSAPYYGLVGGNAIDFYESEANMNFHAGEVAFRQRPHNGLEYSINYTFSKNLTDSVGQFGVNDISGGAVYPQNNYNLAGDYGPAGSDLRHMLNGNWVYQLPVGRGKRFGGNIPLFVDELIGGWKLAGSGVLLSGFPVTIQSGTSANVGSTGTQRANHYRTLKIRGRQEKGFYDGASGRHETTAGWWGTDPSALNSVNLNTDGSNTGTCSHAGTDDGVCAYGVPASANGTSPVFGTASVGTERSAGFRGVDASLVKDFTIAREHKLEFVSYFYNLGNITSYNNPGRGLNGSSTWGLIQSTRSQQRQIELALKYKF
jgi:hypothetical protein